MPRVARAYNHRTNLIPFQQVAHRDISEADTVLCGDVNQDLQQALVEIPTTKITNDPITTIRTT